MEITPAQKRTAEFYAWEQRGRGWLLCPEQVQLEPPFMPFYAFQTPSGYIDDGRKETWLSTLASWFNATPKALPETRHIPYPDAPVQDSDESGLEFYTVHIPKQAKGTIEQAERLLSVMAAVQAPLSVEIVADSEKITLQWIARDASAAFVKHQLIAHLPDCVIEHTFEDRLFEMLQAELSVVSVDFGLGEECMRPLATYKGSTEPLVSLFALLEQLQGMQCVAIQVLLSGAVNSWPETLVESVSDGFNGSFFLDAPDMPNLAKQKGSKALFGATIRLVAKDVYLDDAADLGRQVMATLIHASASPFNAIQPLIDERYDIHARLYDLVTRRSHRLGMLLNAEELATFVHVPAGTLSRKLSGGYARTAALPRALSGHRYALGLNTHLGTRQPATLDEVQRSRHIHIIGSSGTGKSTLIHGLFMQDVHNGEGCMLIDPHGDLYEAILNDIPREHIHRVVLIDPTDSAYPIGFNILLAHGDVEKELLASDLVALFRRFSTSWGDQMNSVFANAISAFVYNTRGGTIGDLRRFLIEPAYRAEVLSTVTDAQITYYWQKEYPLLKNTSIGSILTRLDTFLRPKVIRNMVCQAKSLDFRMLMDTKKVVLVKLSQGLLGTENSYLLGAMMVSKVQQIAMARQVLEAQERVPFHCYIDEFHHFTSPTFNEILSGSRKYALSLVVAHQQLSQVTHEYGIAESLMANAGTRILFRLNDTDAKRMQEGLTHFSAEDIQNLRMGEAIVRVNTNDSCCNITVQPFVRAHEESYKEAIKAYSRKQYGTPIQQEETPPEPPPPSEPAAPEPQPEPPMQPVPPAASMPAPEPVDMETPPPKERREHVKVQQKIKQFAQQQGFMASTEVPTAAGGLVDVLLEKNGTRIAVEVSVSTPAAWELHNVQKCLTAGVEHIVVCCPNPGRITALRQKISAALAPEHAGRVQVLTVEDLQDFIISLVAPKQPQGTTMKGYRVKVQYDSKGVNADDIIQRIVGGGTS